MTELLSPIAKSFYLTPSKLSERSNTLRKSFNAHNKQLRINKSFADKHLKNYSLEKKQTPKIKKTQSFIKSDFNQLKNN